MKALSWEENASVMIKGHSKKAELKYPAVTICPKVSTKYAIAERLGNYIDPMNLPKELLALRHDFFMCATGLNKKISSFKTYNQWYSYFCGGSPLRRNGCQVLLLVLTCVILILYIYNLVTQFFHISVCRIYLSLCQI